MSEFFKFLTDNMGYIFLICIFCGGGIAAFFQNILARREFSQRERAAQDHEYRMMVERRKLAEHMDKLVDVVLVDKVLKDDFDKRLQARQADKADKKIPPTRVRVESQGPATPPSETGAAATREATTPGSRRRNG